MRKKRSKLRSHISSSNSSAVLPAATTWSIHWRIWPRRKSAAHLGADRAALVAAIPWTCWGDYNAALARSQLARAALPRLTAR